MRRIVITGMGVVSPLGSSMVKFWQRLIEGPTGIGTVTRFDPSRFSCRLAGEVSDAELTAYNKLLSHEAKRMDRFIRYALIAASDALQDCEIRILGKRSTCGGVYLGVAMGGLPNIEAGVIRQEMKGVRKTSPFLIPSLIPNMAASMIASAHNFTCVQYTIAGACASGSQAIGQAMQAIKNGSIVWALAGGTEAVTTPITFSGFEAMRVLSTHSDSNFTPRPFDQERDGMIVGEGAAIFILEEQIHAENRGAKIYGELSGYSTSSGGSHIALQSAEDTVRCIDLCLADSSLDASDINCIYAQASGMVKGDAAELAAICSVFAKEGRPAITSIKGHIGHSFAASGPLNLAAALLAIAEQKIPPTLNFETAEPQYSGVDIVCEARKSSLQHCLINAFGFGGVNACLIVSKYQ